MSDRNLPPGFGVGPANAWGQMMDESLRIRDEAKDEQRERRRMSERNEAGLWLDRLEALDAEVGGEITALTHRLAEAERQRDKAMQLAHDQGETIIGLRGQLAEAERQRDERDELAKVCGDAIQFVVAWSQNHGSDGNPSKIGMRVVGRMRVAVARAKGDG